jgi:hypothetical protein
MAMAIYYPVALFTNLNALSGIDSQGYQGWRIMVAKFALHIAPFPLVLALATHKKGVSCPAQGKDTPTENTKRRLPRRLLVRGFCFGQTL